MYYDTTRSLGALPSIPNPVQWVSDRLDSYIEDLPREWGDRINRMIPIWSNPAMDPEIRANAKAVIDRTAALARSHKAVLDHLRKLGLRRASLGVVWLLPGAIAATALVGIAYAMWADFREDQKQTADAQAVTAAANAYSANAQLFSSGMITKEELQARDQQVTAALDSVGADPEADESRRRSGVSGVIEDVFGEALKLGTYALLGFLVVPRLFKSIGR